MKLQREDLFFNTKLSGGAFTAAYSDVVDEWILSIVDEIAIPPGAALVAMGGYGRRELSPQSDLDIALVHTVDADIASFADQIWYPIWNEGIKLGPVSYTHLTLPTIYAV